MKEKFESERGKVDSQKAKIPTAFDFSLYFHELSCYNIESEWRHSNWFSFVVRNVSRDCCKLSAMEEKSNLKEAQTTMSELRKENNELSQKVAEGGKLAEEIAESTFLFQSIDSHCFI